MGAVVVATAVQADYSREKRPLARMIAAQTANNHPEEEIHWIVN